MKEESENVLGARGLCYKARDSYGIAKDGEPPAGFHYDRWLGPTHGGLIMKNEAIMSGIGTGTPGTEMTIRSSSARYSTLGT